MALCLTGVANVRRRLPLAWLALGMLWRPVEDELGFETQDGFQGDQANVFCLLQGLLQDVATGLERVGEVSYPNLAGDWPIASC
jgi:hypothetical protein